LRLQVVRGIEEFVPVGDTWDALMREWVDP
jgi:hypothetical protein